ncbi:MAG: aldolase/citrate lyase family protein [Pseudomonadota bacterium]
MRQSSDLAALRLTFITGHPTLARFVIDRGVDRVMVDLEVLGKDARQGHLNTVISRHTLADVAAVRAALPAGTLLVRVNPLHAKSAAEIDMVVAAGADRVMLPMFRDGKEVRAFAGFVAGRVPIVLLAETAAALSSVTDWIATPGVEEVHVGLNDLSLDLGLPFMFQPLAAGMLEDVAQMVAAAGKRFAIGGIARIDEGLLPARLILGEHVRLGSTGAILSRTFHRQAETIADIEREMDFGHELALLRDAYRRHTQGDPVMLANNRQTVAALVEQIAARSAPR